MAVDEKLVNDIVRAVIEQLKLAGVSVKDTEPEVFDTESSMLMTDITSRECKSVPLLKNPKDPEALKRMMRLTTARIGVGSAGARLKTQTLLTLRADHALARDAVIMDVDQKVLENLNLFTVQTCCKDKNEYLTRPDLGRKLSIEGAAAVR